MDAQENGSTSLEALARRLEALERENAELRNEVAALRGSEPLAPATSPRRPSEPQEELEEERISRRRLLGRAGAAAAGLVVAGALTQRDIRQARAASPAEEFVSNTATPAVLGTNTDGGPGVKGTNTLGGVGVRGEGFYGVLGDSSVITGQGVYGNNSSAGDGILGNSSSGTGIRGSSLSGAKGAVVGQHSGNGYGGQFGGGKAQLRLVPGGSSGRPGGAHSKGEIYMDSAGALFVCVRGGTPGRWRKVNTTAV